MDAITLLTALSSALDAEAFRIDKGRWSSQPAYRTFAMKGNAIRGAEAARDEGVLQRTMEIMGYGWGKGKATSDASGQAVHRAYGWEWQQIDLVAATAPGPWGECVWKGKYAIDLALELENNPSEFTLHMRGLLDFNASLRVGVFFTSEDSIDHAQVGTGDGHVTLANWRPPWKFEDWGVYGAQAWPLVAVFLSEHEPRIVGARRWSPTGRAVEDLYSSAPK